MSVLPMAQSRTTVVVSDFFGRYGNRDNSAPLSSLCIDFRSQRRWQRCGTERRTCGIRATNGGGRLVTDEVWTEVEVCEARIVVSKQRPLPLRGKRRPATIPYLVWRRDEPGDQWASVYTSSRVETCAFTNNQLRMKDISEIRSIPVYLTFDHTLKRCH